MNKNWNSYKTAALGYFLYGLVYLSGAMTKISSARVMSYGGISWWVYYVLGMSLVVIIPIFIWQEYKWLTRILSILVLARGALLLKKELVGLYAGVEVNYSMLAFAWTAIFAGTLMFWAGWRSGGTNG